MFEGALTSIDQAPQTEADQQRSESDQKLRSFGVVDAVGLGIEVNGFGESVNPEHGTEGEKAGLDLRIQANEPHPQVHLGRGRKSDPDVAVKKSF